MSTEAGLWTFAAGCLCLFTGVAMALIGRRRGEVGGLFKAAGPRGWAFLVGGPFLIVLGLIIVIIRL